jgi:hypothetical protein
MVITSQAGMSAGQRLLLLHEGVVWGGCSSKGAHGPVITSQAGMAVQHLQLWWCSPWDHTVRTVCYVNCVNFVQWVWDVNRQLHWQHWFLGKSFAVHSTTSSSTSTLRHQLAAANGPRNITADWWQLVSDHQGVCGTFRAWVVGGGTRPHLDLAQLAC